MWRAGRAFSGGRRPPAAPPEQACQAKNGLISSISTGAVAQALQAVVPLYEPDGVIAPDPDRVVAGHGRCLGIPGAPTAGPLALDGDDDRRSRGEDGDDGHPDARRAPAADGLWLVAIDRPLPTG
jgi:hypothetical protein